MSAPQSAQGPRRFHRLLGLLPLAFACAIDSDPADEEFRSLEPMVELESFDEPAAWDEQAGGDAFGPMQEQLISVDPWLVDDPIAIAEIALPLDDELLGELGPELALMPFDDELHEQLAFEYQAFGCPSDPDNLCGMEDSLGLSIPPPDLRECIEQHVVDCRDYFECYGGGCKPNETFPFCKRLPFCLGVTVSFCLARAEAICFRKYLP